MTGHEEHEQTATVVEEILQSWRSRQDRKAQTQQPQDPGDAIEVQADAMDAAAASLADLLKAAARKNVSLDVIAIFSDLSRAAGSIADTAAELRRQDWFDLEDDDEENHEMLDAWGQALAGLRNAEATFKWVADGWI